MKEIELIDAFLKNKIDKIDSSINRKRRFFNLYNII